MGISRCDLQGNLHLQLEWEQRLKALHPEIHALGLSQPALRALWTLGVRHVDDLRQIDPKALESAHGIGSSAWQKLQALL